MTSCTLGSIPLTKGGPSSGASFSLVEAPEASACISLGTWQVEVQKGIAAIVARGGADVDYDAAYSESLAVCQQGLDILSISGETDAVIKNFGDEHLVWWLGSTGLTMRATIISVVNFESSASAVALDVYGNVTAQPSPAAITHHPSYRYFRLSQTTDDLFDAFRNLYLALESILSDIAPQLLKPDGRPAEGEGAWALRALGESHTQGYVDLTKYAPSGSEDPIKEVFDEIYGNVRSPMSHAKSGRKVLVPYDETERGRVISSLVKLAGIYLQLVDTRLGVRRPSGGMFAQGFRYLFSKALDNYEVRVTGSPASIDSAGVIISDHPVWCDLPALTSTNTDLDSLATRLWAIPVTQLESLPHIRQVIAFDDESVSMEGTIAADLSLGGFDLLEVQMGMRMFNVGLPRTRYPS